MTRTTPCLKRTSATAAAAPPLDPPGVTPASQGLSVRPCRSLSVNQRTENAGVLVRPMITAPARRRLATTGLSSVAIRSFSATTPLSVAGNWQGSFTLPAGVIGDTTVWGSVLPDGGLFFYTNSSLDHNALYGRLIRYENNVTNNRFVTANDGVFFNRLLANTGAYNESVLIDGTLQSGDGTSTAGLFSGSFSYPTQPGGFPTRFSVTPDPLYALPSGKVPNAALIVGTYKMAGTGFGGDTTTLTVFADGAITGLTTSGCEVAGKLLGELGSGLNLYRVEAFGYLNSPNAPITCGLSSGPPQSGSASAQFDANGKVIGLRILTAGLSVAGTRAHTVFVGAKQTTP